MEHVAPLIFQMTINSTDKAVLLEPEYLHAYCSAKLGKPQRVGNLLVYPCPYGSHTRPKLQAREYRGRGVAKCWACGVGGTVFDVAAAVEGLDVKKDFPAVVQAVADTVGYILHDDLPDTPKKSNRKRKTYLPRPPGIVAPPPPETAAEKPLEYLPPEAQQRIQQCMQRAEDSPEKLREHADLMGIPLEELEFRTHVDSLKYGGIGLDEKGRLIYVYAHNGNIFAAKTRNQAGHEPRFILRGSPSLPWGMDDSADAETVIITEGESDAMAIHSSFYELMEWVSHNAPDRYPRPELFPAVIAKPSASTFNETWGAKLRGKDVILAVDNDDAGRNGAKKTTAVLRAAGVRRIFTWLPPDGFKDARAALDVSRPWTLAENLLTKKTKAQNG